MLFVAASPQYASTPQPGVGRQFLGRLRKLRPPRVMVRSIDQPVRCPRKAVCPRLANGPMAGYPEGQAARVLGAGYRQMAGYLPEHGKQNASAGSPPINLTLLQQRSEDDDHRLTESLANYSEMAQ